MCPLVSSPAVRCIENGITQDPLYILKVPTSTSIFKILSTVRQREERVVRPLSVSYNAALRLCFPPRDGELAHCGRSYLSKP